ncbi:MAG: aminotransferase class V-fold PLP-dependent enzyme [Bacteroidota bacterium]
MKIETKAIHAGNHPDETTGAVVQPISLASTFERAEDGSYPKGFKYSRASNPNRTSLEECVCSLEGGAVAAAFSSGSAAAMSIFQSLNTGDHVIVPSDMYHGITTMLKGIYSHWNLQVNYADMQNLDEVRQAFQPNTRALIIESPSNPMMKISDIQALAEIAHSHKAMAVCDNTFATPILQNPFHLGADLVFHSSTKYLGGHSDVIGGIVVSKNDDEFFQRIREVQQIGGAVPSPFDCFLTLRGIRTLAIRMKVHSENAMKVAQFLHHHPKVEKVYYPGLPDDEGHELAKKQMKTFGGMLSFLVKGDENEAMKTIARCQLFTRATSLGSVESLIEHRASIEGPATHTPQNLIRLSIGIEHADDLIADLKQALS